MAKKITERPLGNGKRLTPGERAILNIIGKRVKEIRAEQIPGARFVEVATRRRWPIALVGKIWYHPDKVTDNELADLYRDITRSRVAANHG